MYKEDEALAASEAEAQEIYENAVKAGGDPTQIGENATDIVDAQKQAEASDSLPSEPAAPPAAQHDSLASAESQQKTKSESEIAVAHTSTTMHAQDQSKSLGK